MMSNRMRRGDRRPSIATAASLLVLLLDGCASPRPPSGTAPSSTAFRISGPTAAEVPLPSPGPASSEPPSLGEPVSLARVLRLAADRNPRIAAARARWKAAIERRPQAVSLADPMVQVSLEHEAGSRGPEGWVYSFSQALPFPTKLALAGDLADRDAETAQLQYLAAIRDVVVEAKDSIHELAYLDRAAEVTRQVEELLRRYATFAAGELPKGGASLPETFRAQAQLAQLQYDRVLVRELRVTEEARLRSLLHATPEVRIGSVEPPPFHVVEAKLEDLDALAEAYNVEFRMAGVSVDRAGAELRLAGQARIPDLTLGVQVEDATHRTGEKDMVTATLGATLPLWEARNAARVREAEASREAAVAERLAQHDKVRAEIARVFFRLNNAQRLVALYHDSLIPQALAAMTAAEELYRAGRASFQATVETAVTWYNFQLAYLRALSDHGQALARLEQALGTTAGPRAPAPEGDRSPGGGQ